LNNYGNVLTSLREFDRAEAMYRRAFALRAGPGLALNLSNVLRGQGRLVAAESLLSATRVRWPEVEAVDWFAALIAVDGRQLDSALVRGERVLATAADPAARAWAAEMLAITALQRGQPDEAERRRAVMRSALRM